MQVKLYSGHTMPMLGLGVYDMYRDEAVTAIEKALHIGYRLIDTATMYNNEREVGDAILKSGIHRSELFITTKVNNTDQGYDSTCRAFNKSLNLLQTDYLDLYLIHWPIKSKRKETWKALEYLYVEGRVRSIGVANYLLPFLIELYEYAGILPAVNQVEFSPYLYLKELLEHCTSRGIVLQAYTPLVRGLKLHDPKLIEMAMNYAKSPAQIILRWCLQHGVSPIPKSSSPERLKENFDVFDFEISPTDMLKLDEFNEDFRVVDDPSSLL